MTSANANLFVALRAAFPADLNACAVETETGLQYSWRDLEEATAMVANLLDSLELPLGSRIAVQVDKSVEALILYLATLRAGLVYLPLNTAYQSAEMAYFIQDAQPAVVVCAPGAFGWISKLAFTAGTQYVFTLGDDRSGSLLQRAAQFPRQHTPAQVAADDLAANCANGARDRRHLHEDDFGPRAGNGFRPPHQRGPSGVVNPTKCLVPCMLGDELTQKWDKVH